MHRVVTKSTACFKLLISGLDPYPVTDNQNARGKDLVSKLLTQNKKEAEKTSHPTSQFCYIQLPSFHSCLFPWDFCSF